MIGIGELAAMGTALAWTFAAMAWTAAGRRVGSLPIGFIRLLIASCFLGTYGQLVRGSAFPSDASQDTWWLLGWSGFLGFFLADLCLFRALVLIGPRLTLLVQSLTPPITALMAWWFMADRLPPTSWLGMLLTVLGVSWVIVGRTAPSPAGGRGRVRKGQVAGSKGAGSNVPSSRDRRVGLLLAAAAAVCQASGFVLSKQGIGDYDVLAATFIRVLAAIAGFGVFITVTGHWRPVLAAVRDRRAMGIAVWGAFVGPFLGVALSLEALRHCHPGVAATIISTTPVLILPFVIVVYHEQVSLRAALGAVVSVLGVALLVL